MTKLRVTFQTVSLPTGSGTGTAIVEEDANEDGVYENSDTLSLSDGVTEYTTADEFQNSGDQRIRIEVGSPSDVEAGSAVVVPLEIQQAAQEAAVGSAVSASASTPNIGVRKASSVSGAVEASASLPDIEAGKTSSVSGPIEASASTPDASGSGTGEVVVESPSAIEASVSVPEAGATEEATSPTEGGQRLGEFQLGERRLGGVESPDAPTNPTATATAENEITVDATEPGGATGFILYRSESSGVTEADYTQVADEENLPIVDTVGEDGEQYFYRLRAYNSAGISDLSIEVFEESTLPAPTIGQTSVDSDSHVTVNWAKNDDSPDGGFDVQRKEIADYPDNPDSLYTLDSIEDGTAEDSAGNFDGTNNGATSTTGLVGTGDAASFGGDDGVSFDSDLFPAQASTYSVWVQTTNHSNSRAGLFGLFATHADDRIYGLMIEDGVALGAANNQTGLQVKGHTKINDGNPHLVSMSIDGWGTGTTLELYVDGELEDQMTGTAGRYEPTTDGARLGSTARDQNHQLDGILDHAQAHYRRLTPSEHELLYEYPISFDSSWKNVVTGLGTGVTQYEDTSTDSGKFQYRVVRNTDHVSAQSGVTGTIAISDGMLPEVSGGSTLASPTTDTNGGGGVVLTAASAISSIPDASSVGSGSLPVSTLAPTPGTGGTTSTTAGKTASLAGGPIQATTVPIIVANGTRPTAFGTPKTSPASNTTTGSGGVSATSPTGLSSTPQTTTTSSGEVILGAGLPVPSGATPAATAAGSLASALATPLQSVASPASSGAGGVALLTGTEILAPSSTDATGGIVEPIDGAPVVGQADTDVSSPAIRTVAVSSPKPSGVANTAISGGVTTVVLAGGEEASAQTSVSDKAIPQTLTGTGVVSGTDNGVTGAASITASEFTEVLAGADAITISPVATTLFNGVPISSTGAVSATSITGPTLASGTPVQSPAATSATATFTGDTELDTILGEDQLGETKLGSQLPTMRPTMSAYGKRSPDPTTSGEAGTTTPVDVSASSSSPDTTTKVPGGVTPASLTPIIPSPASGITASGALSVLDTGVLGASPMASSTPAISPTVVSTDVLGGVVDTASTGGEITGVDAAALESGVASAVGVEGLLQDAHTSPKISGSENSVVSGGVTKLVLGDPGIAGVDASTTSEVAPTLANGLGIVPSPTTVSTGSGGIQSLAVSTLLADSLGSSTGVADVKVMVSTPLEFGSEASSVGGEVTGVSTDPALSDGLTATVGGALTGAAAMTPLLSTPLIEVIAGLITTATANDPGKTTPSTETGADSVITGLDSNIVESPVDTTSVGIASVTAGDLIEGTAISESLANPQAGLALLSASPFDATVDTVSIGGLTGTIQTVPGSATATTGVASTGFLSVLTSSPRPSGTDNSIISGGVLTVALGDPEQSSVDTDTTADTDTELVEATGTILPSDATTTAISEVQLLDTVETQGTEEGTALVGADVISLVAEPKQANVSLVVTVQALVSTLEGSSKTPTAVTNVTTRRDADLSLDTILGEDQLGETKLGSQEATMRPQLTGRGIRTGGSGVVSAGAFLTSSSISSKLSDSIGGATGGKITTASIDTVQAIAPNNVAIADAIVTPSTISDVVSSANTAVVGEGEIALTTSTTLSAIRFVGDWILNQRILGDTVSETRTWDGLEVEIRADRSSVVDVIRPLESGAGKAQVVPNSGGGFDVIQRGGGTRITFEAPDEREEVRSVDTWHVEDIEEEAIGQSGSLYDVTLELIPERQKAFDNSLGTLSSPYPEAQPSPDEWFFEFEAGQIATRRVSTGVSRTPRESLEATDVTFSALPEETRIVEESVSKLNANNLQSVPDANNVAQDTTDDERNTMFVRAPFDWGLDLSGETLTADGGAFEPGDSPFSISIWGGVPDGESGVLASHRTSDSTTGWEISVNGDGTLHFEASDGSTTVTGDGSVDVTGGDVRNILLVWTEGSPDEYEVLVDGDVDISGSQDLNSLTDANADLVLGGYTGQESLDFTVYEAQYFSTQVSGWDRQYDEDPVAYWPVRNGSGTTVVDESGNGHDATLSSESWTEVPGRGDPEDTMPSGRYLVDDWETAWAFSGAYNITLTSIQL